MSKGYHLSRFSPARAGLFLVLFLLGACASEQTFNFGALDASGHAEDAILVLGAYTVEPSDPDWAGAVVTPRIYLLDNLRADHGGRLLIDQTIWGTDAPFNTKCDSTCRIYLRPGEHTVELNFLVGSSLQIAGKTIQPATFTAENGEVYHAEIRISGGLWHPVIVPGPPKL